MYDMYQEIILEHYRNPRNFGIIKEADAKFYDVNSLCGDKIEVTLRIKGGKLEDIRFNGSGCAISQASASMLTEAVKGKSLEEASKFSKQDLLETLGIPLSASRLKCALLGLKVFKLALYGYIGKGMKEGKKKQVD